MTGLAGRALQILSTCTVLGAVFGCGLGLNDYFVLRKELRKELEYADDEMGGTSRKRDAEDDDFIPGHKERKAKRKRKQQAPLMLIPLLSFVGGFIGLILGLLILFLTYVCYGST